MGSPRPDTLSRTYPAIPESVPQARHDVVRWLEDRWNGTLAAMRGDVELAISEGVSNVVNHAYQAGQPGEVRVDVGPSDDDGLQVVIEDDGAGMVPRPDSPGVGLGLPLIATIAERFDTSTHPGAGTRLCMVFRPRRSSAAIR